MMVLFTVVAVGVVSIIVASIIIPVIVSIVIPRCPSPHEEDNKRRPKSLNFIFRAAFFVFL